VCFLQDIRALALHVVVVGVRVVLPVPLLQKSAAAQTYLVLVFFFLVVITVHRSGVLLGIGHRWDWRLDTMFFRRRGASRRMCSPARKELCTKFWHIFFSFLLNLKHRFEIPTKTKKKNLERRKEGTSTVTSEIILLYFSSSWSWSWSPKFLEQHQNSTSSDPK
jgi:hypothetical protein